MPGQDHIQIKVSVPDGMTGEALGKLNLLGGLVTGVTAPKPDWTLIEETLPRASMLELKTWLQEYSQGQGEVFED